MTKNLLETIEHVLFRHKDCENLKVDNGIFLCRLEGGSLRYLHKIFVPHGDAPRLIESVIGGTLPKDYERLIKFCNGATLFDNSLFLYGADRQVSRSLKPSGQVAGSIFDALEEMKLLQKLPHPGVYAPVGAVAASTEIFNIFVHSDGQGEIVNQYGKSRTFPSLLDCLAAIIELLDSLSGPGGLFDESKQQLERNMTSFLSLS